MIESDEDAAFAAAQWASGVSLEEIAALYGYKTTRGIKRPIYDFFRKYLSYEQMAYAIDPPWSMIPMAVTTFRGCTAKRPQSG
jgi:hypothetical protein